MIEKCLRKDPTRRPSVKKLLEHKFFKAAKDKSYIVDKIVKRMTLTKKPPAGARLLNLCELRHPTLHGGGGGGVGDGDECDSSDRPISVGSWVFDKQEFDEMKMRAAEEKESMGAAGNRNIALQASYAHDDEHGHTDAHTPHTHAPARLSVPVSGGNRAPSSSADDDSSESDHDDTHAHAQQQQQHATPQLRNLHIAPALALPGASTPPMGSPVAAAAADSTAPTAASCSPCAALLSPPPLSSEHQEGRFHVSEDADGDSVDADPPPDDQYAHPAFSPDPRAETDADADADAAVSAGSSSLHPVFNRFRQPDALHDGNDDDDSLQPAFHNDDDEPGETRCVGRFTCSDDN